MRGFFFGLAVIMVGGVVALLDRRRPKRADWSYGVLVALGCVLALRPALTVLSGAAVRTVVMPTDMPGGPWEFGIDPLSAFFLIVVLGVGAVVALYGIGYLTAERAHRPTGGALLGLAALLVALALVVTARAALPFLISWEVMSLLGYFLVIFEHQRAEVRRAGLVYLAATHAGTLALFLMFAAWSGTGTDLTFDGLAFSARGLPYRGAVVLLLALLGFGIKAGLVPLHFWLPGAHSAAPSHISAAMSGIVIKMGVYGLIRVTTLMGVTPAWWGWALLTIGVASGVLGVLWALTQHDLKRLLAYHSVENIGIILLGTGLGALGLSYGRPAVAALGFAGAVLHTLNHALFKSLLFFGAGSLIRETGTREIDRLGGLARTMPLTWVAFLVGAAAIVGLPPLNGFVSEWVVYQALFQSGLAAEPIRLAVLGAAGLALIGGLALACFAKVAGTIFLGRPRSYAARGTREAGAGLTAPMFVLVSACVLIGMQPLIAVGPALTAGGFLAGTGAPGTEGMLSDVLTSARLVGSLALGLVLVFAVLRVSVSLLRSRRIVGEAETWASGYPRSDPRMQYTAASFAAPIIEAYAPVAGVQVHERGTSLHTHPTDVIIEGWVFPLWRRTRSLAGRLRPMQQGRLHMYLLYVVAVVLVLLLYLVAA